MWRNMARHGAGWQGIAIGAGAVVLAPIVASAVAGVARPLLKSAVKAGVVAYDQVLAATAEARESFEDMVAESRQEISGASAEEAKPTAGAEKSKSKDDGGKA